MTWLRLYLVPRELEIQTSKPLSARMYAKDWSGGLSSHVTPSYIQIKMTVMLREEQSSIRYV